MRRHLAIAATLGLAILGGLSGEADAQYPRYGYTYVYSTPSYTYSYVNPSAAYSTPSYGTYGLPGNYYQPTYPSYLPYAPNVGATPAGSGYPVTSLTYTSPTGERTTYGQSSMGNAPGLAHYYNMGYAGYSAPSATYSYGRTPYPTPYPGYVAYGPAAGTGSSPGAGLGNYNFAPNSAAPGIGVAPTSPFQITPSNPFGGGSIFNGGSPGLGVGSSIPGGTP